MPWTGGRNPKKFLPTDVVAHGAVPGAPGRGSVNAEGEPISREVRSQGQLTRLPAIFAPPPGSNDFSASATVLLGAGPSVTVVAAAQIPANSVGVVRSVSFSIRNMLLTTVASFAVLINGGVVAGWNYTVFPQAAATVTLSFGPEETFIVVPDGATVGFQVTITDAVAYTVGGLFHGWHFSKATAGDYGLSGI